MSDISVKVLRSKVDQFLTLKNEIKSLENQISDLNKKLTPVTNELNELMEAMELTRFDGSLGKITRVKIDYVSNPATDEQKEQFNEYLKEQGLFDEMVSVHHAKLNSFYRDQLELAIERGEELIIPGLEPKQRIEIRKSR